MKKKILALLIASFMALSFTGCGGSDDSENAVEENSSTESTSSENGESENSGETGNGDASGISQISQSEIEGLADNQFYAANSTGVEITEIYVSENGSGDWGSNLLSSPIANGQKVIISASGIESGKEYDICVVDADSNTTEYYNFDIVSTVQVTFYENAQCDVSSI